MYATSYNISFPLTEPGALDQDEAFFLLREDDREVRVRFHDYSEIYRRPGLYEQLFYQRLRCISPDKATEVLTKVLQDNRIDLNTLRVLDLGAGNGMMGEQLDAARVVGVDIIDEARKACERDRPQAYDAYYVADLCALTPEMSKLLGQWKFDCLSCIAALGFGDVPVNAFAQALNLVQDDGWVVFNLKETFMRESDQSGFSRLIKDLMLNEVLEVHHLERYRHRISIDGRPLFYYVMVARKKSRVAASPLGALKPH